MINPDAVAVEIFNDGEVEVFIVPVEQYGKCYSDGIGDAVPFEAVEIGHNFLRSIITLGHGRRTPYAPSVLVLLDCISNR